MSGKSWYSLNLKAAPTRYGLTKNIQTLLQALDKYYCGSIDAVELGALVRLSPRRRAAIANTIAKCAKIIKKEPEEIKTCVDIIEMCTEILEIAGRCHLDTATLIIMLTCLSPDRPVPDQGFPFMKLPIEIRECIIERMVDNIFTSGSIKLATQKVLCNCAKIERPAYAFYSPQMKALPSLLGPALSHEFFRIFFRKKVVRFRCCCELDHHLSNNPAFFHNVRQIKVHWSGLKSGIAFKKLATCPVLEGLELSISKSTLAHLDERSESMKQFFSQIHRNVRITDVLGLDEVMSLRGLKRVAVSHILSRSSNLAAETDRANLAALLEHRLKQTDEVG